MRIYMLKNKVIYFIYPFYIIENTEHTSEIFRGEIFPVTKQRLHVHEHVHVVHLLEERVDLVNIVNIVFLFVFLFLNIVVLFLKLVFIFLKLFIFLELCC